MLGEFEYLLLAAIERVGDGAYGVSVLQELQNITGRTYSLGALYTTLNRLESKSLITTWMGEATPQRGGRAKRMVQLTAAGVRAASEFHDAVTRASRGVRWTKRAVGQHS